MTTMVLSEGEALEGLAREIRCQVADGQERLCMERLLRLAPWCRRQTERLFRERFLTSPTRYFRDCQWDNAERLLKSGENVLEASLQSGFASPGRLHDAVVQRRGMTPGEIRRRGAGVQIKFGFFDTQIGVVLLAATPRGLCALRLCQFHGAEEQLTEMAQDFPQAERLEDAPAVQPYADQLVAFLDARTDIFNPPLDITLRHDVPARSLDGAAKSPAGPDRLLHRTGRAGGQAVGGAGRRRRLRPQPPRHRHPLPPRRPPGRLPRRLPLGRGMETAPTGAGSADEAGHIGAWHAMPYKFGPDTLLW